MTSSTVAFCQFLRFLNGVASYIPLRDYQNFWINESYIYQGVTYIFAPFKLSGQSMTRGADISESQLVTIPNDLTVGIFAEAVQQRWLVETAVALVSTPSAPDESPTFDVTQLLSKQIWTANSFSHSTDQLVMNLASPLNLTTAQVPRRVLTSELVGPLPATGNIYAR